MNDAQIDYRVILEEVLAAARAAALQAAASTDPLDRGRVMAYYDVLDVAKEQAELLGHSLADVGLPDFDPDSLLASAK